MDLQTRKLRLNSDVARARDATIGLTYFTRARARTHGAEKTTTRERTTHSLNKQKQGGSPPLVAPHVDVERIAYLANADVHTVQAVALYLRPWQRVHRPHLIRRRWGTRWGLLSKTA